MTVGIIVVEVFSEALFAEWYLRLCIGERKLRSDSDVGVNEEEALEFKPCATDSELSRSREGCWGGNPVCFILMMSISPLEEQEEDLQENELKPEVDKDLIGELRRDVWMDAETL